MKSSRKIRGRQALPLVAVFLMAFGGHVRAHQGDRIYSITELTDADLASIDLQDGDTGDWEEIVGNPALTALDFAIAYGQYDPSSFDFRLWFGWHDATDRLYVAMQQIDDVYINGYDRTTSLQSENELARHDGSIRVYVDGDHNGGQYRYAGSDFATTEEWAIFTMQQAQVYSALGEVFDKGTHIGTLVTEILSQRDIFEDWFVQPPYAEGGGNSFSEAPTIVVTEFYVTLFDRLIFNSEEESLVSDLYPGKTIGLALELSDHDMPGEGIVNSYYVLPWGRLNKPGTADGFADFVLVGAGEEMPENTAVQDITWARIKASFAR